ncbi:cadmium-translocating P-type ATPase [Pseudomethylobacillus aquaticus]|uniref:Cadmium-translocating P-type ATPase n=1 Tax=Pseudomethylobacillus aquaticus TaxID=2676064 RepID=A0A3N0UVJ6_9PROT|nr:heavy metal translocating P-type ATPase [Pseudomethylobacillus aquaticus]ROH84505.1 cadmium-translocating P-type ATPase [Pseudomethylobacillus aquaticus]
MAELNPDGCYHCGLPLPTSGIRYTQVLGQARAMCCPGCAAVATAIVDNGLEDYYRYRTELPRTAETLLPEALAKLALYDHPQVQRSFVRQEAGELRQASLILEGITCAACIWLNERHLQQLDGVVDVAINYGSQRARVRWDEGVIKLSHILAEIEKLGYHAHPFSAAQQDALRQQQRKADFRRLAVAGLCAGQVMMIAVALYAGPTQGLDHATAQILRWFSLVLSIPAMSYAALPFYRAAWRGLRNHSIGMDVPISLGLITGFIGSIWATLAGSGEVYYDTLTMLIFFLLCTRYLERNAREKSVEAAENLLRLVPAVVTRIAPEGNQLTAVADLACGDVLLIKPGETIATDGVVIQGESSADESLLTGESQPVPKSTGSHVLAGSINYESPLQVQVTATGEDTVLAGISRLLDRAQAEKPRLAQLADQVAAWFTYVLLALVVLIGAVWYVLEPARCLEIVLTVLVVSCPCALSLAAPAAFAAAGSHLIQRGVLLTRGHALETLARITHVVFDKTGTLTQGRPVLLQTEPLGPLDAATCLQLAASLEHNSEHPLARSFLAANSRALLPVEDASNIPGQGVTGTIHGRRYRLGNAKLRNTRLHAASPNPVGTLVWLSDEQQTLAMFVLADQVRPHAQALVTSLQQRGLQLAILSGDNTETVRDFAATLSISDWQASLSPAEKLAALHQLQQQGAVVAMVGDGINDAPVLAGAQVSIAMGSGTQLARASGDVVLLTEDLREIAQAIATSRFGIQVIRQNFAWALAYNAVALPFAAVGLLSPWMAAIGMSISSLIVVLNALRLR